MKAIKDLLNSLKKASKERDHRINLREAEGRYNIVKRDGEIYLTLDGERISTDYSNSMVIAVTELLDLRDKYINKYEQHD